MSLVKELSLSRVFPDCRLDTAVVLKSGFPELVRKWELLFVKLGFGLPVKEA